MDFSITINMVDIKNYSSVPRIFPIIRILVFKTLIIRIIKMRYFAHFAHFQSHYLSQNAENAILANF